jgi:hypothetical protein
MESQIFCDARAALPLPDLLKTLGDGHHLPVNLGGTRNALCPFCDQPGKFSVYEKGSRWLFKCMRSSCQANRLSTGHTEIGYLIIRKNLSPKEASREYLRLALPNDPRVQQATTTAIGDNRPEYKNPSRLLAAPENPWHTLWSRLILNGPDRDELMSKRGFSKETIELLGFASNNPGNKPIVETLSVQFREQELVELGILKAEFNRVKAAGQLIGWGNTGRKDEKGDPIFAADIYPTIIPYFDGGWRVRYLRPHKGGLTNPDRKFLESLEPPDEDAEKEFCSAHVYFPPNLAELLELSDGHVVFTEGEFKVGALTQCDIAALSCPGITFIRNPVFRRELLQILEDFGVTSVTIIFDNEVKNDPNLPGYKADPQKQHDSQIWAEFTQKELAAWANRVSGVVKLGKLPDELRDPKGKADFDGILAAMVKQHGLEEGTQKARAVFLKSISEASEDPTRGEDGTPLHPGDVRRLIDRKLHMMRNFKRRLPYGGDLEMELAHRFAAYDSKPVFTTESLKENQKAEPHVIDKELAEAFRSVQGCYYKRENAFPEKKDRERVTKVLLPELEAKIKSAEERKDYDALSILYTYRRTLTERLKGIPKPISTFRLVGEFRSRDETGSTRLVRAFNSRDKRTKRQDRPLLVLDAADAAQPSKFDEWIMRAGEGNWLAGVNELKMLNADLDDETYLREIHAVSHFGFHKETNLWFYGDVAFWDDKEPNADGTTRRSRLIKPDANGVYWHEGIGYRLDKSCAARELPRFFSSPPNRDGSDFDIFDNGSIGDCVSNFINTPKMQIPATKALRDLLLSMAKGDEIPSLHRLLNDCPHEVIEHPSFPLRRDSVRNILEEQIALCVFTHLKTELPISMGQTDALDGWLIVGALCAYAVGPELVSDHLLHPGLFFTGGFGSGKTDTALKLSMIWGSSGDPTKLIDLGKGTTMNALARELQAASSVPLVCDEYRRGSDNEVGINAVLRTSTQRTSSGKATHQDTTSTRFVTPRTSPIVCGENSPSDSATASRFIHVIFSKSRREKDATTLKTSGEAWNRIKAGSQHYHHLGRWLMTNRLAFSKAMRPALRDWKRDPQVLEKITEERIRTSIGVGYCAFVTIANMLGNPLSETEQENYKKFCLKHGGNYTETVKGQSFRHQFWEDIITGLNRPTSGIKPIFFAEKHIVIEGATKDTHQSTGLIREALGDDRRNYDYKVVSAGAFPNAVHVLFIDFKSLYEEWAKDLRTRSMNTPITLPNLRDEMKQESYFIDAPKKRKGRHIQRLGEPKIDDSEVKTPAKPVECWCVTLEMQKQPTGEYECLNPFGKSLMNALGIDYDGKPTEE